MHRYTLCHFESCNFCSLVARDLCGFFSAFFVFLEMILAHRYERSSEAIKSDAGATIIVVPETRYAPQRVYGLEQQPGLRRTDTMPYQALTTPLPGRAEGITRSDTP
jgi:hypothetical protein